jgi:hypothetical protein
MQKVSLGALAPFAVALLHKSQEPVQKAINFAGRKAGCSPQPTPASERERERALGNSQRTTTGKCIYPSTQQSTRWPCVLCVRTRAWGRGIAAREAWCVLSLCAHNMETAAAAHMSAAGKTPASTHSTEAQQQTKSCSFPPVSCTTRAPAAEESKEIFACLSLSLLEWQHTGNARATLVL